MPRTARLRWLQRARLVVAAVLLSAATIIPATSDWSAPVVAAGPTAPGPGQVALTFDDGPSACTDAQGWFAPH